MSPCMMAQLRWDTLIRSSLTQHCPEKAVGYSHTIGMVDNSFPAVGGAWQTMNGEAIRD
ncbi:hypothetical protein CGRA01v4_12860 [Colletotrichum graminicola]|nr:hypothetical protein CGRA01v4_12860 [Colletotrichum graminicola]